MYSNTALSPDETAIAADIITTIVKVCRVNQLIPPCNAVSLMPCNAGMSEMRRAMTELQKDPEIEEIRNSGRPIDGKAVITLMNHPAVLELIDQPGFMEQAKAIIQDPTWNTMTGP